MKPNDKVQIISFQEQLALRTGRFEWGKGRGKVVKLEIIISIVILISL